MWLAKTHRNFLIVCVFLFTFNAWQATVYAVAPARAFNSAGLVYVNEIPRAGWSCGFAAAAILLGFGIWRTSTFHLARLGMALGLMTCATRMILLTYAGAVAATGMPTWLLACGIHLASVLEPPLNPATQDH